MNLEKIEKKNPAIFRSILCEVLGVGEITYGYAIGKFPVPPFCSGDGNTALATETSGGGSGRMGMFMLLFAVQLSPVVALLRWGVLCGRAVNWPARWALN